MNHSENQQFFDQLEKAGITVPKEHREKIAKKIDQVLNYVPSIGVFGKTGVGKSSLCNALFGAETCKVSDIAACTRDPQEIFIGMGKKSLKLVDVPGVGESRERDQEYGALYKKLLPELDLVLWVLKADDRAFSIDESFYKNVVKPHIKEGMPFFIVLNQADKIEPSREWNDTNRQPGSNQAKALEGKRQAVAGFFELPLSQIIAVSANERFGLVELVDRVIDALPGEKRVSVLRNVEKEYQSDNAKSSAEKGLWSYVKDGVEAAVGFVVEKVVEKVWKKLVSWF